MSAPRRWCPPCARTMAVALMLLASIATRCSVTRVAMPVKHVMVPVAVEVVDARDIDR